LREDSLQVASAVDLTIDVLLGGTIDVLLDGYVILLSGRTPAYRLIRIGCITGSNLEHQPFHDSRRIPCALAFGIGSFIP
jgi:hypothetical protein